MISIIVAVAKNRVIGKEGDIPWKLSDDLRHFAKITKGHTVIMGRKTYESVIRRLGCALPERKNIVITSQGDFQAPGCMILHSFEEAMRWFSNNNEEMFVIGGSEIYKQFLPHADKLYVTEVNCECAGDAFFPPFEQKEWEMRSADHRNKDKRNSYDYSFLEYVRK
jgi:dihydrofolate reductase